MRENSKATNSKRVSASAKNTRATTTNNEPQHSGKRCGGKTCKASKACK